MSKKSDDPRRHKDDIVVRPKQVRHPYARPQAKKGEEKPSPAAPPTAPSEPAGEQPQPPEGG